jgi:hypothetical protein
MSRENDSESIHGGITQAESTKYGHVVEAIGPRRKRATANTASGIPSEVARRYQQVDNRLLFPDGTPAIEDRRDRLIAATENRQVARDLVAIAHERAWTAIRIRGSEAFRTEVWHASRERGIAVRGYAPPARHQGSGADSATAASPPRVAAPPMGAERSLKDPIVAAEQPRRSTRRAERTRLQPGQVIYGQFVEAGAAPYQFRPTEHPSFYVRIKTPAGTRDIWGSDLRRALAQSRAQPQPGDEIGVQFRGSRTVPVPYVGEQASGGTKASMLQRQNLWNIENPVVLEAQSAKAETLRKGLSEEALEATQSAGVLQSPLAVLRAAELFAQSRLSHPEDRSRFTNAVRSAIAQMIETGESLPSIALRAKRGSRAERETRGQQTRTTIHQPAQPSASPVFPSQSR